MAADVSADASADALCIIIQHLYKEEVQHSTFVNSNMVMRYPKNIKVIITLRLCHLSEMGVRQVQYIYPTNANL